MSELHVSLFGGMRVTRHSDKNTIKLTRTSQLMLAYLLLGRQRLYAREVLSELFWGNQNEENARHSLSTALWRLRSAIERKGSAQYTYLVVTDSGEIGFNSESDYWLDVAIFEECVNRLKIKAYDSIRQDEIKELEAKSQLYVGELLEGVYTDWAIRAREYERLLYLDALKYLMGYYSHHNAYLRALEFGQKILDLDPLREDMHREMMRLYLSLGQRSSAVHQYEVCRQNLKTELGITPLEETQLLYTQIVAQSEGYQVDIAVNSHTELREVYACLQQAAQNIEAAQEQFQMALRQLQTLFPEKRQPGNRYP